ncbi:aminotransferase class IV [Streptomyces sp. NBC_01317]|uniref:aminotransferase class IV n=1 Tax=Streptomyces sp. NBC_01317 TaxID=2903822 RepID=UPI002E13B4BE|nr:aminotransferase class IV [Streptomyces sp. NBC_01317]
MGDRVMWFNGSVVPWEDARVHVWDELALRGANVFEGMTAFWDATQDRHLMLAAEQHVDRLFNSARIADIPAPETRDEVFAALAEVASHHPGKDVYLRPTFYAARGRSTLAPGSEGAMYIGGFEFAPVAPPRVRAVVSAHRRFGGPIGPLAKSGGSYLDFRVFERERTERGAEHIFILNEDGHVAEADGAAILIVRDQEIIVPSVDTGVLDSITKRILLDIARDLGRQVTERRVLREELYDGQVLLAGTLLGIRLVDSTDGVAPRDPGATDRARELAAAYDDLCRGGHPLSKTYLTPPA